MISMEYWEKIFISDHRVARLATVDSSGQPHVVPIVYAFDGDKLYTPIDEKPKRVQAIKLRRVRNILSNPKVSVIVDDYSEDWRKLAWVQLRGNAQFFEVGSEQVTGVALLHEKYPQYADMSLRNQPIVVIQLSHISSWRYQSEQR